MKCPECGLETVIYRVSAEGPVYVCRNKRCGRFDQRLRAADQGAAETPEPREDDVK